MEARLIAVEEREGAAGAGERVEGDGDAVILGEVLIILAEALLLIVHAVFEEAGFDASVASDAPMGGGELMDEIEFGLGLRAEVVQIIAEMDFELVGGFIKEDDRAGGKAVSEGVHG